VHEFPFIANREFVFQKGEKLYIVSEFIRGGDIFHHLLEKKRFSEEQVRFISAQIIMALGHYHKENIVYKDLKAENVLV